MAKTQTDSVQLSWLCCGCNMPCSRTFSISKFQASFLTRRRRCCPLFTTEHYTLCNIKLFFSFLFSFGALSSCGGVASWMRFFPLQAAAPAAQLFLCWTGCRVSAPAFLWKLSAFTVRWGQGGKSCFKAPSGRVPVWQGSSRAPPSLLPCLSPGFFHWRKTIITLRHLTYASSMGTRVTLLNIITSHFSSPVSFRNQGKQSKTFFFFFFQKWFLLGELQKNVQYKVNSLTLTFVVNWLPPKILQLPLSFCPFFLLHSKSFTSDKVVKST